MGFNSSFKGLKSTVYNSDSALYLVSVEPGGSSFGVEAVNKGNTLIRNVGAHS